MPDTNFALSSVFSAQARLGPALVTAVCGGQVEVEAGEHRILAALAVPGIYAPVAGDTVLVIENADAAYVIGVLHATGPSVIRAAGDLRLLAPNGEILLQSGTMVARAEEMSLSAERLAVTATRLTERFTSVRRAVAQIFELDAGELRARIGGTFSLLTKRLCATAEDDVKIDGKQIHLG